MPANSSAACLHCSLSSVTQPTYVTVYITSIDDAPVFTLAQAQREFFKPGSSNITSFGITLIPQPALSTQSERTASLDELNLLKYIDPACHDENDLALTMDSLCVPFTPSFMLISTILHLR